MCLEKTEAAGLQSSPGQARMPKMSEGVNGNTTVSLVCLEKTEAAGLQGPPWQGRMPKVSEGVNSKPGVPREKNAIPAKSFSSLFQFHLLLGG